MRRRGRECRYAAERRVPRDPRRSLVTCRQSPMGGRMSKSRAVSLGFVAALAAAAILGGVMSGGASAISRASTITPAPAFTAAQLAATPSTDWLTDRRRSDQSEVLVTQSDHRGERLGAQAGLEDEPRRIRQGGEVLAGGYADRSQRCHLHPHGEQRHLRPRRHDGRAPLEIRVEDRPEQQHDLLRLGLPRARLR